jgi:hypothetical protein
VPVCLLVRNGWALLKSLPMVHLVRSLKIRLLCAMSRIAAAEEGCASVPHSLDAVGPTLQT